MILHTLYIPFISFAALDRKEHVLLPVWKCIQIVEYLIRYCKLLQSKVVKERPQLLIIVHKWISVCTSFFVFGQLQEHPQLQWQISWFGSDKDMLYIIFTGFSCWFQTCSSWNDPMGEIRGQPVLGHTRPSPSTCFGSKEGFESSLVIAETGKRAWPRVL